jgi:hypothetical protein
MWEGAGAEIEKFAVPDECPNVMSTSQPVLRALSDEVGFMERAFGNRETEIGECPASSTVKRSLTSGKDLRELREQVGTP